MMALPSFWTIRALDFVRDPQAFPTRVRRVPARTGIRGELELHVSIRMCRLLCVCLHRERLARGHKSCPGPRVD